MSTAHFQRDEDNGLELGRVLPRRVKIGLRLAGSHYNNSEPAVSFMAWFCSLCHRAKPRLTYLSLQTALLPLSFPADSLRPSRPGDPLSHPPSALQPSDGLCPFHLILALCPAAAAPTEIYLQIETLLPVSRSHSATTRSPILCFPRDDRSPTGITLKQIYNRPLTAVLFLAEKFTTASARLDQ